MAIRKGLMLADHNKFQNIILSDFCSALSVKNLIYKVVSWIPRQKADSLAQTGRSLNITFGSDIRVPPKFNQALSRKRHKQCGLIHFNIKVPLINKASNHSKQNSGSINLII